MGEPINAERVRQHYATVVSPTLALTPFAQRTVVGVPAVTFENSIGVAVRTFGNSANLFTLSSVAVNLVTGSMFKPAEGLLRNPAERSPAVAHGHTGVIVSAGGGAQPAAVVAGKTPDADMDCTAELLGLMEAIAEKAAEELKRDPWGFLGRFTEASDSSYQNAWVAAYESTKSAATKFLEFMDRWGSPTKIMMRTAEAGYRYVDSGQAQRHAEMARRFVQETDFGALGGRMVDFAKELSQADLKAIVANWLIAEIRSLGCDGRDMLRGMLNDPRPMSTQLGELHGTAKAGVHIIGAGIAVEVLVTRGALTAASRGGVAIAKAGSRMGGLLDNLGEAIEGAWERSARRKAPDPNPPQTPPATPRAGDPTPETPATSTGQANQTNNNASIQGRNNGRSDLPCLSGCG